MPAEHGAADDAGVWDTLAAHRTILMACRGLTSTIRLLETHELFRDDVRLRFVYAVEDGGSRFHHGSRQLLARAGVDHVLAWHQVHTLRPHLTLTASENIDPRAVSGPIVVLPHGIGFNKYVPTADGASRRLAGLPSTEALRTGRVLVALAHQDQDAQLRTACPDVAGHTVVTGDATFDRLVASRPLRDRYRRLLHGSGRQVVLVSSTWGPESTLGRRQALPTRLLAELSADRYRVCLALHPNIWSRYGRRTVEFHLGDALDAGLALLPPDAGWHAAMLAADLVIADHGSLALYAAGLGTPLLLTGAADETVPGTPVARLAESAPWLRAAAPLAEQVEQALSAPRIDLHAITDRVFGHRGTAVRRVREQLYRAVDLAPPGGRERLPRIPDPLPVRRGPWSFRVRATQVGDTVHLTRYPAAVRPAGDDVHLVVTDEETNLRLLERAAVLCRQHRGDHADANAWASAILTEYPGARLAAAAVGGGCVVVCRDGRRATVSTTDPADTAAQEDPGNPDVPVLASFAYHCLHNGWAGARTATLAVADRRLTARIRIG